MIWIEKENEGGTYLCQGFRLESFSGGKCWVIMGRLSHNEEQLTHCLSRTEAVLLYHRLNLEVRYGTRYFRIDLASMFPTCEVKE